jgi:hypothetical protein
MELQPRAELEAEKVAKRARPGGGSDADGVLADGASDSSEKESDSDDDDAGGGADGGSGAEKDKKLGPLQYGANTPTGPAGRLSKLKVDRVWHHIKRL